MLPVALVFAVAATPAGAVLVPNTASPTASIMPMMYGAPQVWGQQSPLTHTLGSEVLGATRVYLIYWDPYSPPQGWPINYPQSTKTVEARFLQDLATDSNTEDNNLAVDTVYQGSPGEIHAGNTAGGAPGYSLQFAGAYTDQIDQFPINGCADPGDASTTTDVCLTDAQIQAALQAYIAEYSLPTGPNNIYLFMTPPDVTTCLDATATYCSNVAKRAGSPTTSGQDLTGGYCGYHSVIGSGSSEIVYGQVPWPYPKIMDGHYPADSFGLLPDELVPYLKDCQPDALGAVSLPNGLNTLAQQPLLTNGRSLELELGDVLLNVMDHELQAITTDPNLTANYDVAGYEGADKCQAAGGSSPGSDPAAWFIYAGLTPAPLTLPDGIGSDNNFLNSYNTILSSGDKFYLQSAWDPVQSMTGAPFEPTPTTTSNGQCVPYAQLTANFPTPSPVQPNQIVGFDPSTTVATLGVAQYEWSFGDGSPAAVIDCPSQVNGSYQTGSYHCNPSTFHGFTTPGTYNVTLKVTDYGGFVNTVTKPLTVLGTPPGGGGGSGSSTTTTSTGTAAATSSSTSVTTTTTTATSATSTVPVSVPATVPPAASESVATSSVSKALSGGLVVNYTASAGLAGRFQVLIDAKTAKKLKITGPVVKGITINGVPNPIQIGTALLVTQKSGASHVSITFTKAVAAKLRHSKQLSLTVRLVARNVAGVQIVKTTTVKLH